MSSTAVCAPPSRETPRRAGARRPIPEHRRGFPPYKLVALLDAAGPSGIPVETLLQGTGLSPGMLDDPDTRTSADQYLVACSNAIRLCDDPELPFRVGEGLHLSAYGLYGFALLCSPTVRDGFTLAVRYHSLATPLLAIAWRETPDAFIWTFPDEADRDLPPPLRQFLLAQQLAQHVTHVQDIARADRLPRLITVRHAAPAWAGLYARHLRCPVAFGAGATEIHYDPSVLDDRPPLTNKVTLAMLRDSCERLIGRDRAGLAGDVARALMERPGEFPSMVEIAVRLGLTPRTLRRRLADEGETFTRIFDRVRCDLATRYLSQGGFTVADVAALVGFDDATNFRRSFRRWTGRPPGGFRRA